MQTTTERLLSWADKYPEGNEKNPAMRELACIIEDARCAQQQETDAVNVLSRTRRILVESLEFQKRGDPEGFPIVQEIDRILHAYPLNAQQR